MRALVTGANGFIGSRLCLALANKGLQVRAVVRSGAKINKSPEVETSFIDDIGPSTDWQDAMRGADIIFHLAGRVHVMSGKSECSYEEYRQVNVEGSRRLAETAVRTGIKRIVYLSSIKVNGELSGMRAFREDDYPSPHGPYAVSKLEAEEVLGNIAAVYGMEVVIIRSPLVYGAGAKGNLLRLMRFIRRGYPLPLGNINNKRSLISLDNLVDILVLSATIRQSAGHTFLVSDGMDVSTSDLVAMTAESMGQKRRLIPFPHRLFSTVSGLSQALSAIDDRLTGSLAIDSSKIREILKWRPPQTVKEGIDSMVSHFLSEMEDAG
jgi:nucleoside-diphosphate-sugar epimerase